MRDGRRQEGENAWAAAASSHPRRTYSIQPLIESARSLARACASVFQCDFSLSGCKEGLPPRLLHSLARNKHAPNQEGGISAQHESTVAKRALRVLSRTMLYMTVRRLSPLSMFPESSACFVSGFETVILPVFLAVTQ
jgi:hypothetical protein